MNLGLTTLAQLFTNKGARRAQARRQHWCGTVATVLSEVERIGPPDGPARVVRHGRAGAGRARCGQSDGVKRRESDRFSSDEGPAGDRPRRTRAYLVGLAGS